MGLGKMFKDKIGTIVGYSLIVLLSVLAFWFGSVQRQARISRESTPAPSTEVVRVSVVSSTPTPTIKSKATPATQTSGKQTATSTPKATSTPPPKSTPIPIVTATPIPAVAGAGTSAIPDTGPLDSGVFGVTILAGAALLYGRSRKNLQASLRRG